VLVTTLPDVLCFAQISSVSVAATFTVLSGQVSTLGWMFREDIYTAVRPGPSASNNSHLYQDTLHAVATCLTGCHVLSRVLLMLDPRHGDKSLSVSLNNSARDQKSSNRLPKLVAMVTCKMLLTFTLRGADVYVTFLQGLTETQLGSSSVAPSGASAGLPSSLPYGLKSVCKPLCSLLIVCCI